MADCFNEPPPVNNITSHIYPQKLKIAKLPRIVSNLGKFRLTALVSFTSIGGYALSASTIDPLLMIYVASGVFLCSMSANCINHILEYPFDSQMERTSTRVLPMCLIKPESAALIAFIFGLMGTITLGNFVSFQAGLLGFTNIFLYSAVYTPLKRLTIYNTHVGSLVGAIPPLIGWVAGSGSLDVNAFVLATILFSWQFVHFNSLSWHLRDQYCKAGYQMMSISNVKKLKRSTNFHSLVVLASCLFLPFIGIPYAPFFLMTFPINLYVTLYAKRFSSSPTLENSRRLFLLSLVQITAIIGSVVILYIHKCYTSFQRHSDRLEI